MTFREYIENVLATTPTIEHFLISSEAVAKQAIVKASSRVIRPRRRAFQRARMRHWRRLVSELERKAITDSIESILPAVSQLLHGGLAYAGSVEQAEQVLIEFAESMEDCRLVGIHEEILSSTIAAIRVWRDA